jgi:hypothetical protein
LIAAAACGELVWKLHSSRIVNTPTENKVIARFKNGTLVKGTTLDFFPTKDKLHIIEPTGDVKEVRLSDLKAIFFVKDLAGCSDYAERKGFFSRTQGKKVMVEFLDGEVLFGHTLSYSARGLGFFLFPGDPDSNNIKVFIVHAAAKRVKVDSLATPSASHTR